MAGAPSNSVLDPGDLVGGRYEVLRMIGRGGMGEVYAARNRATGRSVALKIIRSSEVTDEQRRRFLREAKAATAISHPNVIDILDVFEDEDGSPVMVMELLEGQPLSALLKGEQRPVLGQIAALLLPVAYALQAAHEKGIVHRDLKPDNIFLCQASGGALVPKVLDFGIAKVIDPTSVAETQGSQTSTGSILGTPQYMSFEQAMSEKDIDHRADIWAYGVILFEAVSGRRPLEFENLGQMYTQFLQGEVPSVRDHAPTLPAGLADAIDHCLRKDRAQRANDLREVILELEKHAEPSTLSAIAAAMGDASLSTFSGRESLEDARTVAVPTGDASVSTGTQGNFEAASVPRRATRASLWLGAAAVVVGAAVWWLVNARQTIEAPPAVDSPAASAAASAPIAPPEVSSSPELPTTSSSAVSSAPAPSSAATPTPPLPTAPPKPQPLPSAAPPPPAASATATASSRQRIVDDLPY